MAITITQRPDTAARTVGTDASLPAAAAEAARRFYNGNAAAPPPPPSRQEADPARSLYGDNLVAQVVDRRGNELFDALGADQARRATLRQDFIDIGRTGLPDGVVAQLATAYIDGEIAAARAEDPELHAKELGRRCDQANAELREWFRSQYRDDAEAMLERTERFARSHPTLASVLKSHGLGSNKAIVQAIAAHVRSTGWGAR